MSKKNKKNNKVNKVDNKKMTVEDLLTLKKELEVEELEADKKLDGSQEKSEKGLNTSALFDLFEQILSSKNMGDDIMSLIRNVLSLCGLNNKSDKEIEEFVQFIKQTLGEIVGSTIKNTDDGEMDLRKIQDVLSSEEVPLVEAEVIVEEKTQQEKPADTTNKTKAELIVISAPKTLQEEVPNTSSNDFDISRAINKLNNIKSPGQRFKEFIETAKCV